VNHTDLRDMFREVSKSASTSSIAVTPPSSTFPAIKTPENTDDPDDPNSADEGISKWNNPRISCSAQVRSSEITITCKNYEQYRYNLIIQNIQ
jgi:hypothetical protein